MARPDPSCPLRLALLLSALALALACAGCARGFRPEVHRVSLTSDGDEAPGASSRPRISADGTRVAFLSQSGDLAGGTRGTGSAAYLRDLGSGTLTRIDLAADGATPDLGGALSLSLSRDGTKAAFASLSGNLVPGDTNRAIDVFVRDLRAGSLTRASVTARSREVSGHSLGPALDGGGRSVAFLAASPALVEGDTNGKLDAFVKDLRTGVVTRLSLGPGGREPEAGVLAVALSADGRAAAFITRAALVPDDTNRSEDVYVTRPLGGPVRRASVDASGRQCRGVARDSGLALSADGRFVAFESAAPDLLPGGASRRRAVYVKDLRTGAVRRASENASGAAANGDSRLGSLSEDGRFVAFASLADNLAPRDTNRTWDVFVKDLQTGATRRVSVSAAGEEARGASRSPSLSADGSLVAYESEAPNLVPEDTNGVSDVFVATTGF